MNTHDIERLIDRIEASPAMDIAGRSKHIHDLRAVIETVRKRKGEVVVTKTPEGEIIAVTRQDDEGRILSVIAEADSKRRGEPVAWSASTNVNPRPTHQRPPPPPPPPPFQPMAREYVERFCGLVRKDSAPQPAEPVKVPSEWQDFPK